MKATLYIKMEGYDDGDFDVSNNYYTSDEEFFDAMDRENKKYSNVAFDVVSNLGNNINNGTAKFGNYVKDKPTKNARENTYRSEAILLDDKGNDETVDSLITKCVSQDVVVNIIKFNRESMDEEFEEDYNFWVDEHRSINKYKDKLGEEKVWENEPVRTLYVEFLNKANETKYVRYDNCKILDFDGNDECAVLAEKITLIENI